MDRMNPLDASFLYSSRHDPHAHRVMRPVRGTNARLSRPGRPVRLRSSPLVPRYRQRCASSRSTSAARCGWTTPTSTSSITYDTRPCPAWWRGRSRAPDGPAHVPGARPLAGRCGRRGSSKASRRRGRSISKVHHCMVDGVAGVDLIFLVLDPTPDPGAAGSRRLDSRPEPSARPLALDAVANTGDESGRARIAACAPR